MMYVSMPTRYTPLPCDFKLRKMNELNFNTAEDEDTATGVSIVDYVKRAVNCLHNGWTTGASRVPN